MGIQPESFRHSGNPRIFCVFPLTLQCICKCNAFGGAFSGIFRDMTHNERGAP